MIIRESVNGKLHLPKDAKIHIFTCFKVDENN